MITTTDIKDILYSECKAFGLRTYRRMPALKGESLEEDLIVLHSKRLVSEKYWNKAFVEVNICVPDLEGGANEIRLNELEHQAETILKNKSGVFNKTVYRYGIESEGIEADTALKCHYVNLRLLFEVLNTI